MSMRVLGIIPSRYASTRFPGKPLVNIGGKSMIRRVWEGAHQSKKLSAIVIATDDQRILDHVKEFTEQVVLTRSEHESGTSRCAEVIGKEDWAAYDVVINIQGDEPYIQGGQIDELIECFSDPEADIASLMNRISTPDEMTNPNMVKVVTDLAGNAMYFSRLPIPYYRKAQTDTGSPPPPVCYKHIGLYGYRKIVLEKLPLLPPGKLEMAEKLEQLRWLEHQYRIRMKLSAWPSYSVDTPEDLKKLPR